MSDVNSLYTIGRSKKNTVKVAPLAVRGFVVTLTEDGGQYRQMCTNVDDVVEYLSRMWGYNAFSNVCGMTELKEKVNAKLKLVSGPNVFA